MPASLASRRLARARRARSRTIATAARAGSFDGNIQRIHRADAQLDARRDCDAARQQAIRQNGIGMDGPLAAGVIAVVLKGYPRLSETFIAQELLRARAARALARALFAAASHRPRSASGARARSARRSPTCPSTCITSRCASGAPGAAPDASPDIAPRAPTWWRDLRRDRTRSRMRRFGQALVLAAELPRATSRSCTRTSCTRRRR